MGSLRVEGSDYLARPTKQRGGDEKEEEERGVVEGEGWGEEEVLAQGGEDRTLTPSPPAATGPRRAGVPGLSNPWRRVPWDQHEGGGLPAVGQRPPVEAAGCVYV